MDRPALLLGNFRQDEQVALTVIAGQAALDLTLVNTLKEASHWMSENEPAVLLVDDSTTSAEGLCLEARSHARHAQVPIMALARDVDDLSFAEAFSWGGDDVVQLSATRSLLARLRSLPRNNDAPALAESRGTALVADSDRKRRVVLARVLQNAGYDILFAASPSDAIKFSEDKNVKLVVISSELDAATPAETVRQARAGGSEAIWIVTTAPQTISQHQEALKGLENAAVTDGFAPPENVVFLANELTRDAADDQRASPRLLFGTRVLFRGAGSEGDDVGYSYNISQGGLYVRTLAPPQDDNIWIEVTPPRADHRVRLEGKVVWRRPFGPGTFATVPPGFGVQITDATAGDRAFWVDRCDAFGADLGFTS